MACVICLSSRAEVVCVPCGHVCACAGCLSPTTVPMGSKRTCPICRKGVAQLLRVFFAGASMNNEPLAAPPPVEADRSRSVCRPVGALLVPVNFISDLRGPRGNVPIPEPMLSISQALCDRSHADQEILAEIEHVENVWMQHCPDPGELSVEEAIDVLQTVECEKNTILWSRPPFSSSPPSPKSMLLRIRPCRYPRRWYYRLT